MTIETALAFSLERLQMEASAQGRLRALETLRLGQLIVAGINGAPGSYTKAQRNLIEETNHE